MTEAPNRHPLPGPQSEVVSPHLRRSKVPFRGLRDNKRVSLLVVKGPPRGTFDKKGAPVSGSLSAGAPPSRFRGGGAGAATRA